MIVLVRIHIDRIHYVKHNITDLTFVNVSFIKSLGGDADIAIIDAVEEGNRSNKCRKDKE
jgi:hypothetical protein